MKKRGAHCCTTLVWTDWMSLLILVLKCVRENIKKCVNIDVWLWWWWVWLWLLMMIWLVHLTYNKKNNRVYKVNGSFRREGLFVGTSYKNININGNIKKIKQITIRAYLHANKLLHCIHTYFLAVIHAYINTCKLTYRHTSQNAPLHVMHGCK